jgi:nucleotide-binding universal stress UspA family protein
MATRAVVPGQRAGVSFKNILLATDLSDASEKAFNYAAAIARRYRCKISLVHVIPPESDSFIPEIPEARQRHEAERQLENIATRSELNQIPHEALLRTGSVWSVLSAVIHRQDTDLVILGTHGRSGIKKLAVGSVAEEVVRRAGCPVLTVGPHIDAALSKTAEFHTILFATDFHSASARALDYALFLANQPDVKLILLHVMPPEALPVPSQSFDDDNSMPPEDLSGRGQGFYDAESINKWQAKVKAAIKEKLQKLLPAAVKLWSEPEYVVTFDFIVDGILKEAAARKADLIIMGAKRPAFVKVSAHSLGAVSYGVIRRANCPVLTVSA